MSQTSHSAGSADRAEPRRKIFDRGLYREGMRQLSAAGIISLVVFCVQVLLIVISHVIASAHETENSLREASSLFGMNPFAILVFCLVTPLMMIYLFRFLSRRSSSDFYHSIPQTRMCLGVSFTAAVLTWSFIVQWGSTLLALVLYLAMRSLYTVHAGTILAMSLMVSSGILFVAGATFLGITLTGTLVTNFVAALTIIFFPRALMAFIQDSLSAGLVVMTDKSVPLIGNQLNFVTNVVFPFSGTFGNGYSQSSLSSGIYTAVLGVIYLLIGLAVFCRRPSETAGKPAVSAAWQTVFRLVPASLVCLVPVVMIYRMITGQSAMDASTFFQIFVIYLIAAGVYFLYEAVTTRRLKKMQKIIPGLAILAIFNVVLIFGMYSMRRSIVSFRPDADDIESVQFSPDTVWVTWPGPGGSGDSSGMLEGYFSTRASDIRITEEPVRQLVSDRLKDTLDSSDSGEDSLQEVTIRSGGRSYSRNIYLSVSDQENLADYLSGSQEIEAVYMDLPAADDPNLLLSCGSSYPSNEWLSDEICREIYSALREDVDDLGFRDWYLLCKSGYMTEETNYITSTLYMRYDIGGRVTGCAVPIIASLPKTQEVFLQSIREEQKEPCGETLRILKQVQEDGGEFADVSSSYCELDLCAGRDAGGGIQNYSVDLSEPAQLNALIRILEKYQDTDIDSARGYSALILSLSYADADELSVYLFLPLPEVGECRLFQNLNDVYQTDDAGESLEDATAESLAE